MEAFIVEPSNSKQVDDLISFLKERKIGFKNYLTNTENTKQYNKDWVEMMNKSETDFAEGRIHRVNLDEIWK